MGKYCGRHQDGHLLASQYGLERCADGYLSLAETHIATDDPVSRYGRLHVALDISNRAELVGRFLVLKRFFELLQPRAIRSEGIAACLFTVPI